jgi:hypothetical protein
VDSFDDIEKPHDLVADALGDRLPDQPLTVRLGDLWSDLLRVSTESDPAPERTGSGVPLLDDMKGILQWD